MGEPNKEKPFRTQVENGGPGGNGGSSGGTGDDGNSDERSTRRVANCQGASVQCWTAIQSRRFHWRGRVRCRGQGTGYRGRGRCRQFGGHQKNLAVRPPDILPADVARDQDSV